MKKKHSYYWGEDTKDEDMCPPEEMEKMHEMEDMEDMHMDMHMDMCEEPEEMHKHMMHMHGHMMHKNMRLAHSYVLWQCYHKAFSPCEALNKGTLFPELFGVYKLPM